MQFSNVTAKAGIHFVHFKGAQGTSTILEEAGPGVCVADYDGDGYPDIYFVNGRDLYSRGVVAHNALYHNNGDGTFTDVTTQAGVPGTAYGLGCVWGDYDNDGFPDLYVSQYGKNVLYHNNGHGTFTDVTDKAGVGATELGTTFHTGATFFDYDRDGRLDLYAGGYADFRPGSKRNCDIGGGIMSSCRPSAYPGSPEVLYHNNGDGTFADVTRAARIYQPNGYNLAVGADDYNDDGWPDLFVANDGTDAYLYRNNRDGTFTNVAVESGMAFTQEGNAMAGMCVGLGDYDDDGRIDLLITDFQMMSDHLWHNAGKGYFDEVSDRAGIAGPTRQVLSFGGGFFDYDNDGWLDIFIANGSVYPEINRVSPDLHYKQINSLFHNEHDGRFSEVSAGSGNGFSTPYAGRGVAFADFDNDGRVDVVVANNGDPPLLLHNDGPAAGPRNHFVNFKLVGRRSNRDAMGTRIRLRAGTLAQVREISGGGSYMSQSDLRASFGLGRHTTADEVVVRWPGGLHQTFRNVKADKFYLIVEGKDQLQPQRFGKR
ncbi:MAG TPA: CRTAC1 family protein [Terriglobia bacterium]|nr:CRTAC1 family protein [Terriglobia bacterium]